MYAPKNSRDNSPHRELENGSIGLYSGLRPRVGLKMRASCRVNLARDT